MEKFFDTHSPITFTSNSVLSLARVRAGDGGIHLFFSRLFEGSDMLVGPFHGYRLKDLNDRSFLKPEQLELLTAQGPLGLDLALDPHAFTFDDDKEVIGALLQMPGYSFLVCRYKSGAKTGNFVMDAQLFQQVWHGGSGYGPNFVTIEAATIPELLSKLRDALLADLTKYLAPLGFTVQLKS